MTRFGGRDKEWKLAKVGKSCGTLQEETAGACCKPVVKIQFTVYVPFITFFNEDWS